MPSDPIKFSVVVKKESERQLNQDKIKEDLRYIGEAARRNQTYGFTVKIPPSKIIVGEEHGKYFYEAVIVVIKENYRSAGAVREQFDKVKEVMAKAANSRRWTLNGEGAGTPIADDKKEEIKEPKKIANFIDVDIPPLSEEVYATFFNRLYNREPHIRLIYDSASTAIRTKFKERNHVLLRGLAGCAKTELFSSFCNFVGRKNVWHVDATTTSKAGLERELVKRSKAGTLAPFLLFEEIEKVTSPENINCLLQVMDARGAIQRTNARDGDVYEECKIVVWATCNDSKLLRKFADGAIWSRFSTKLICKRPDRELMHKILTRCANEMDGGKPEWVPPIINFLWDVLREKQDFKKDYNDPRLGRSLLASGDRIFDISSTGAFQDFLKCCEGDETGEESGDDMMGEE